MSSADTALASVPSVGGEAAAAAVCAHCGLDVPSGLVAEADGAQFCCTGCRTAFEILHAHGLEQYYRLSERRDLPVRSTGRSYEELDHPTFQTLYVKPLAGGLAEVELYLEGVHCASCVWLVERVPLVVPGVTRAELQIRRSLARVAWNPATVPLSRIARALDSLGYPPHPYRGVEREAMRRREDRAMLVRIGVAGAIAGNVMLASLALYSGWLGGMEPQYERFFRWVGLGLVTPALLWPGRIFFAGGWAALRTRTLHMDVPIAIGLAAGYLRGAVNTAHDSGPVYFDGLAMLVFALLVGRYLQQRGQRAAANGAELLYSLTPSTARTVDDRGAACEIPSEALLPGMIIDVHPGETIVADGRVTGGRAQLDTSLLTGESRPVSVGTGERVYAGTVVLSSPLHIRVEQAGEASRVARIMRQVEESSGRKAPVVETANRIAVYFVAVVLALAAATFVGWQLIDPARAADNAIALLIVTCPCALALSTPLAVSMAIGRAARAGIFIKGGDALERLSRPGRMLLDKTGTLTEARTALVRWSGPEWAKPLVLALERESPHPIARGFRAAWPGIAAPVARGTEHVVGGGITGFVDQHSVIVGAPAFVRARAAHPRAAAPELRLPSEHTPVLVAVDGEIVAAAEFGDPLRADSRASVDALRARGWTLGIVSGDAPDVVRAVGDALAIPASACTGGASPEEKKRLVESAQSCGSDATGPAAGPVVMVGDGINDAAALAAAPVGIGVHGGAEACLASASIYLTRPGLASLVELVDGAERTMRIIRRNIAFSLVYNLIGSGLAIAGVLTPLVAAILMPASSLTVLLASWRGRTFDAGPHVEGEGMS